MTRTAVLLATLLAACTAKNPERERPAVAVAEPAEQALPPEPAKPDPPKPEPPKPEPSQPDPPPVDPAPHASTTAASTTAEPDSTGGTTDDTGGPTGPVPLVAAPIVAADVTATWREVTTLPAGAAPDGFFPFATGVLAGVAPNFYTADAAGAWVPVDGLENPPGVVSGHWPDESWAFQYQSMHDRAVTTRVRLLRLRGKRWVPQTLLVDQWHFSDDVGATRKSWKIGYFAVVQNTLLRVASNGLEAPDLRYRGSLRDIVESKAGDVFTLSEDGRTYYVQTACADPSCVDANAIPLPPGSWEWAASIPRQKHSVSLTLREPATARRTHVLHYETGGWKLEALPDGNALMALWPTADGGLWAQTETALLHRDPAGAWRKVALPEGVQPTGPVFAAMTGDMSELWLLGARDGAQIVLATKAKAQAPG